MIMTQSENQKAFERSLKECELLVLDIETLDSKLLQLWSEPIISFSISLASAHSAIWEAPTLCYTAQSPEEEYDLLVKLKKILFDNQDKIIAGHNVSWEFKNRLPWKNGFDLPKIYKRGLSNGLDFSFVKSLKVFDSMDEAFVNYDHSWKLRYYNGTNQKVLRCEHIEEDFGITRPTWLPKLGPQVRQLYEEYLTTKNSALLRKIHLYNICDSMVEAIIAKIFLHYLSKKCGKSGKIAPGKKCAHIPSNFIIDKNITWAKMLESNGINLALTC